MYASDNRKDAHEGIDHIFKMLFPAKNMPERAEQIALSHRMLDALLSLRKHLDSDKVFQLIGYV